MLVYLNMKFCLNNGSFHRNKLALVRISITLLARVIYRRFIEEKIPQPQIVIERGLREILYTGTKYSFFVVILINVSIIVSPPWYQALLSKFSQFLIGMFANI